MTQWEIWDRLMAEDEERRVRIAHAVAAAEKIRISAQVAKPSPAPERAFALLKRRPGEGKINRTAEGCTVTVYYDEAAIAGVAKRLPRLLPELLQELEGNEQ